VRHDLPLRLRHDRELQGRLFLVALLLLAGAWLALSDANWQRLEQNPATLVEAEIISFGVRPSNTRPGQVVSVATVDGTRLAIAVSLNWATGCKAGDRVILHRRGTNYRAAFPSCRTLT